MRCDVPCPPCRCGPSWRRTAPPRPRHPISVMERRNALEARGAPRSHPYMRLHLASPRPREAGRAQAGAWCCPVRAPVRPTCARAATAAANARKQRGRARAPPPLHWSRVTCSHACACTAVQLPDACALLLQPPPPRGAASTAATVLCPPAPRAPNALRGTCARGSSRGSSRASGRQCCRCRGFKAGTRSGRQRHLPASHAPGRYANDLLVSSPLSVGPAPSVGTGAGSGGLLRNRPIAGPAILVACK